MNFFRLVLSLGIIVGIIAVWECVREDVNIASIIRKISNIDEAADNKQKVVEKKETIVAANNADNVERQDKQNQTKEEKIESGGLSEKSPLINFEKGFEDVCKGALNSVVNVATQQIIESGDGMMGLPDFFGNGSPFDEIFKDFFDFPKRKSHKRKAIALGSGFIVQVDKERAYIVTNNHVVEKAKKIIVLLSDKTELNAEVYATDPRTDIAILSVDLKGLDSDVKMKAIEWGDSDSLSEGNFVIAIGNPFGLGSTFTFGIVSAKGRNLTLGRTSASLIEDFIQHSAQINSGNSGGCLLNVQGKVVGINNAILTTNGGNVGVGFAIPSSIAKNTVAQLIKYKRTFRGWLGAEIQQVTAKQAESVGLTGKVLDTSRVFGGFVSKVVPNGPAEKAGIKAGDIILEFNGKQISEKCSLQTAVSSAEIGSSVKVKLWRQKGGEKWSEVEVLVTIGDYEKALKSGDIGDEQTDDPESKQKMKEVDINCLGVTVSAIPEAYKKQYPEDVKVIVTKVDEEKSSSFYGSAFNPGDGFIMANNKKITSVSQLKDIIDSVVKDKNSRNRPIPFVIVREGSRMMIATTLDFSSETEKKEKNKE
ncbi:MAG: trypsin-like peptidase domain-containing protein [Holosporales bacterium]|jgi:serine protease Do|nr:trypsin-like peptidase domain-containing protein [Holosporales bacterium]